MDAIKIANGLPMWIACGIPVALVLVQALVFARNAWKAGEKIGLTDQQMKHAV